MAELSWPVVATGDPPVYPDGGAELNIARHRVMFADRTGVVGRPGTLDRTVFADGSGLQVKRRAGARWVQGIYATDNAEKTLPLLEDPDDSLWRVDRVVDRLTADGVITTVLKTGTAAVSPSAPPLTQTAGGTWEESLATFRVAPGAVTVATVDAQVADERRFMPSTVTPVSSEALRPAAPLVGDEVDFPDGRRQRWTGATWVTEGGVTSFTPSWTAAAVATFAIADVESIVSGKHCAAWAYLVASNNVPTGNFIVKAPLTPSLVVSSRAIPMGTFLHRRADGVTTQGLCFSTGVGDGMYLSPASDTSSASPDLLDALLSGTIAPNDSIRFNLSYPIA